MIERSLQRFFWDVDASAIDLEAHAVYVIERLAEVGDADAARWMITQYGRETVLETILQSRRVSPRSKAFWRAVLAE